MTNLMKKSLLNFRIAFGFGYKLNLKTANSVAKSINLLLQQTYQKPEKNLLDTLAIRSMSKAIYTTQNIGHGLNFTLHSFTSPIRRYSDVIVHRLLQYYLTQKNPPKINDLEQQLKHCTDQEILATKAERDSINSCKSNISQSILVLFKRIHFRSYRKRCFIELVNSKCEGFIRIQIYRMIIFL